MFRRAQQYTVEACPTDTSFNIQVSDRLVNWRNPEYLEKQHIWQDAVNDKLGGAIFATRMGVRVPRILYCSTHPQDLMEWDEVAAGATKGFVVKAAHAYSSRGVYVLENGFGGVNKFGRRIMARHKITGSLVEITTHAHVLVEELVKGPNNRILPPP